MSSPRPGVLAGTFNTPAAASAVVRSTSFATCRTLRSPQKHNRGDTPEKGRLPGEGRGRVQLHGQALAAAEYQHRAGEDGGRGAAREGYRLGHAHLDMQVRQQ